jgi:hypothetical protein
MFLPGVSSQRGGSRALCHGAALDYVNKRNGVKDFDVWSIYAHYGRLAVPGSATRDFWP